MRFLLAQLFLPIIGGIWGISKGITRLMSENMLYYKIVCKDSYIADKRYSNNLRYDSTQEVAVKQKRLKKDAPLEVVKEYHSHAIKYIILGLICIVIQCFSQNKLKRTM